MNPCSISERQSATLRMRPARGFSLLELLIAMAMAAMLALSLYAAMNVALRARGRANDAVEPTRAVSIAMDLIQRDFESVPPPTGTLGGPFYALHQPLGSGDNDLIEFCTIGADPISADAVERSPLADGIRRIELYVQSEEFNSPVLIRRVTRNLMPASEPLADEEILCRNVRSFSLRYFDGIAWQENWDSTTLEDALPLAVAITLELGEPDPNIPGHRMTRVIPLSCAQPIEGSEMMMIGGVQ